MPVEAQHLHDGARSNVEEEGEPVFPAAKVNAIEDLDIIG